MKQLGSQLRETLKESGYKLVSRGKGYVILEPRDYPQSPREMWYANNDHSGYTVQVGRWEYEFGRDVKDK